MNNLVALPLEFKIQADLKTIIKYHSASSLYFTKKNELEYWKVVKVKVLQGEEDTEFNPIKDYRYEEIANRILPDPSHSNTLLALVQHLVEIDWEWHAQSFIKDDHGALVHNEYDGLRQILNELKTLVSMLDNEGIAQIRTKVQLTETKPFGDKAKVYDVKGMGIQIFHSNENKEIVQLLIKNRIANLRRFHIDLFFSENFAEIDWNLEKINEAIALLTPSFQAYRANWLFCKLVSETVLKYLKNEMEWNQGDVEVTEKQGVFIHTLLALFNFIELEQELKNKTDRDKAKFIRSFFRKDIDATFPELTYSEF